METLGIWERDETIAAWLRRLVPQTLAALNVRGQSAPFAAEERFSALLIGPGLTPPPETVLPGCRLLLLPGDLAPLALRCDTPCIMSYGLSDRDSLSLSATRGGHYALSIQRELLTLRGLPVEQQELILPRRSGEPLLQMALVLLLLALDVAPEALADLFHSGDK